MAQSHLFVMDPLVKLKPHMDTSLALAFTLSRRGAQCYMVTPDQLSWKMNAVADACCQRLVFGSDVTAVSLEPSQVRTLRSFEAIHLRQEPPFDMTYLTTTWLLDTVVDQIPVWNHPAAVRTYNEKLAIYEHPEYAADAVLTADFDQALEFLERHGHLICKPLDLFGGQGIFDVQKDLPTDIAKLKATLETGSRLLQPFDNRVYEGEIRAFAVGGKPVAWCLKRPPQGEFLANTSSGATIEPYEPDTEMEQMVSRVSEQLAQKGLAFVGFDIIGDKISEVNVTSPRMLRAPGQWESAYEDMADWVLQSADAARMLERP